MAERWHFSQLFGAAASRYRNSLRKRRFTAVHDGLALSRTSKQGLLYELAENRKVQIVNERRPEKCRLPIGCKHSGCGDSLCSSPETLPALLTSPMGRSFFCFADRIRKTRYFRTCPPPCALIRSLLGKLQVLSIFLDFD